MKVVRSDTLAAPNADQQPKHQPMRTKRKTVLQERPSKKDVYNHQNTTQQQETKRARRRATTKNVKKNNSKRLLTPTTTTTTTTTIIDSMVALEQFHNSNEWYINEPVVAMDCEGVPSNLHMVQIATRSDIYIFDGVALDPHHICTKVVQPLVEDPSVVKLWHDLRNDAMALSKFGKIDIPHAILDTQLVMDQLTGKRFHGLNATLEHFELEPHPQKKAMVQNMKRHRSRDIFKIRPLSHEMIEYCANDVQLLLGMYEPIVAAVGRHGLFNLIQASIDCYQCHVTKYQTTRSCDKASATRSCDKVSTTRSCDKVSNDKNKPNHNPTTEIPW